MRRIIFVLMLLGIISPEADACVGRILNVGVVNSPDGQVLAELLSNIINERTGTTVNIRFYKTSQELYDAVKVKQVDISFENTTRAMHLLNKPVDADAKKAYESAKAVYEKEKGLVWLKPFGFLNGNGEGGESFTAPVVRVEVFSDFPALPRVIEKLGGVINDETYTRLIKSVESGEKPKKAARDFLKAKKLI